MKAGASSAGDREIISFYADNRIQRKETKPASCGFGVRIRADLPA
jgi:hypothetical protein